MHPLPCHGLITSPRRDAGRSREPRELRGNKASSRPGRLPAASPSPYLPAASPSPSLPAASPTPSFPASSPSLSFPASSSSPCLPAASLVRKRPGGPRRLLARLCPPTLLHPAGSWAAGAREGGGAPGRGRGSRTCGVGTRCAAASRRGTARCRPPSAASSRCAARPAPLSPAHLARMHPPAMSCPRHGCHCTTLTPSTHTRQHRPGPRGPGRPTRRQTSACPLRPQPRASGTTPGFGAQLAPAPAEGGVFEIRNDNCLRTSNTSPRNQRRPRPHSPTHGIAAIDTTAARASRPPARPRETQRAHDAVLCRPPARSA